MTRACPRSPVFVAVACQRPQFASSLAAWEFRSQTSVVEYSAFEFAVREILNRDALRRFAVLQPLKLVIENYAVEATEHIESPNHPANPSFSSRTVPFSRELYIERDDFMEVPSKGPMRELPSGAYEVTGVAARKTLQIVLVLRLRLPEIPDGNDLRCGWIRP